MAHRFFLRQFLVLVDGSNDLADIATEHIERIGHFLLRHPYGSGRHSDRPVFRDCELFLYRSGPSSWRCFRWVFPPKSKMFRRSVWLDGRTSFLPFLSQRPIRVFRTTSRHGSEAERRAWCRPWCCRGRVSVPLERLHVGLLAVDADVTPAVRRPADMVRMKQHDVHIRQTGKATEYIG